MIEKKFNLQLKNETRFGLLNLIKYKLSHMAICAGLNLGSAFIAFEKLWAAKIT